ncbi:MAG: MFS transporter [Alistipes sp.]
MRPHPAGGTFRPWLLWGALPFGALGVLTFMPEWGTGGKVVYATVTYSLMMIVYSSVNVPYAALLGVMSADPHERTVLAAFRMTFAAAGSMAVVLAVEALVKAFRRGLGRRRAGPRRSPSWPRLQSCCSS